jgi:DNA helicase IV
MPQPVKSKPTPRMSDEAVKVKTGKTWKQWFDVLTRAGARKMSHQEIVKLLASEYEVGPWWQQMVAVTFEQQSGLRDAHQRPDGYQISVSKTLNVSTRSAYQAFANENRRSTWLDEEGLAVRTATPNKSMRLTWKDGKTSLEVAFAAKAPDKTQVVVQHSKLPDAKIAAKMKSYWREKLDRLQRALD